MKFFKKPEVDLWDWHRWFAWYPVVIWDEEQEREFYVWLETVERKRDGPALRYGGWKMKYRLFASEEKVI